MAAGATCIIYGELKILNVQTTLFNQELVYDESNTDLMFFKFTIRGTGYLTGRAYDESSSPPNRFDARIDVKPTPGDGQAGHHAYSIRHLTGPRKAFEYRTGCVFDGQGNISGGSPVLTAAPFESISDYTQPTNRDVNNGPKVTRLDITHVVGDSLFAVEFEFEVCKIECDANGNCPNTSGVLSNRWSVEDVIDGNRMTTRTFRGRLRGVSSRINLNSFRGYVIPPLSPGMRRAEIAVTASETGLDLIYSVTDREIAYSAPAPATTWRMAHSEWVQREQLGYFSEVNVTLGGDRTVDKKLLISIAAAIAKAKVTTQANPNACFLQSIKITDEYSDDASLIHLHAVGRRVEREAAVFALAVGRLGKPIEQADLAAVVANYDRNLSRGSRQGESVEIQGPISMVGAWTAYLQSPCSNEHHIFPKSDPSQTPAPSQNLPDISGSTTGYEIPDDGTLDTYSDAMATAMYTFYQMESVYEINEIVAHLPVAATPTSLDPDAPPDPTAATSVFVKLGSALPKRVIRVTAERVGEAPKMMNPALSFVDENGITNRLLSRKNLLAPPERTADNKKIYRERVEFVFGMNRDPTLISGTKLRAGVNPWERSTGIYDKAFTSIPEEAAAT